MSYSFVWLYLFKCDVCVLSYIWINPKSFFDHFICIWKWFLSLFVFMFCAYFVFHCLSMFCVEKQVLEFLATHFGYLRELPASCQFWRLASREFKPQVHIEGFWDSLTTQLATHSRPSSWLASRKTSRIRFLKSFFMGNLF